MRKQDHGSTGWHPSRGNAVHPGPIDEETQYAIYEPVAAKKRREIDLIDRGILERADIAFFTLDEEEEEAAS